MPRPEQIQQAIRSVTDQRSFIEGLLRQTLNWPINLDFNNIGEITYELTDQELDTIGLSRDVLTGPVLEMQPLEQTYQQQWGIFILEFANPTPLLTGRGLTGPLRKVLRGLVSNRRNRPSNLPIWDRENLLFICTHNYQDFRFAYFKPAKQKGQAEPLAMFGWDSGDAALRTLCEYNLPFLIWSDNPQQPQWRDAFNVEKVTKGFYSQVAKLFTDLVGGIRKEGSKTYQGKNLLILPGSQNDTIRKEFAVRLIGRLVFCWFLKKKKSKGGVPLLPQELLSTESINNKGIGGYYHSILEPLFFEVLNTPQDERNKQFKKAPWSIIPFLNGGLFTPHEDDFYKLTFNGISEHLNDLIIPDSCIKELFEVFETYNFAIEESTPLDIEVAVDPEILGRIFENLLAEINPQTGETARKATGSYYTPRPIVEYMVDESLKQYLLTKTKLSEETISSLLSYAQETTDLTDTEKDEVLDALDTIKIIDPACGSGAFPIGILQKILLILQKIDPDSKKWLTKILAKIENSFARKEFEKELKSETLNYIHKLGIIQNSIYGVDIQPIAVEISKLRFFLSLIVDENVSDKEPNRAVKPLPNLEFKFVCANTLIGLPKQDKQQTMFEDKDLISELKRLRDEYLGSYGNEKELIEEKFRKVQSKMFAHTLNWSEKETQTSKLSQWDPFSHESCPWFDPEWMFGIKEGFDVVIGNPPYISISKLTKESQNQLYKLAYKNYTKVGDVYCLFFEKGIEILRTKGTINLITSNQWLQTEYGKILRNYFVENTNPLRLINFGGLKVFQSSTVDTSIFISEKERCASILKACHFKNDYEISMPVNVYFDQNKIEISDLKTDRWFIGDENQCLLKEKIKTKGVLLGDWNIQINYGIKTGYNKAFIIDGKTKNELIAKDKRNAEIIKPILRGRDLRKHGYRFANLFLINSHNGIKELKIKRIDVIKDYPVIFAYLSQFKKDLIKRQDKGDHWSNLRNCTYFPEFENPKVIYPETIVRRNEFSIDTTGMYLDKTCFMITGESLCYLNAVLTSKLMEWYLESELRSLGKKSIQYSKQYIENIPVPKISEPAQRPFIALVNRILAIAKSEDYQTNESMQAEIKELENQIDQMVYALYGLTAAEIAIVKGHSKVD